MVASYDGPEFACLGPAERHPTPVPCLDRVAGSVERRGQRGYPVEGTSLEARWVTALGGNVHVEVTDTNTGVSRVETLEDLNRWADKRPGGPAHRILRAVEGGGK